MNDHIVDVDDALRVIAGEILAANMSDAEWAAVESDDGFQRGAWLGGYDADERAFCFGRKTVPELWCQFDLADAPGIAQGAVRSLPARLAE
jgi:hypothetical protein